MVLTEFLQNLTAGNLQKAAQLAAVETKFPTTITGQGVSPGVSMSESFQSALSIFDNILKGGELPETFRQSVTTQNLLGLGQASKDASKALNEQITLREQQLTKTNESIRNQSIALGEVNERISRQVTELGKSLQNVGSGQGFDALKFFTDNPIIGGIGIGGVVVGGIALLLLLRR